MRRLVIPVVTAVIVIAAMLYQGRTVEPRLCEAPVARLGEIPGFKSETFEPSEAELHVLPSDTLFDKRVYTAPNGESFRVSLVIGGRSKSSIHRPELCLPAQGYQMMDPRNMNVAGVDWHLVTLAGNGMDSFGFAYTFFNQEGFRTSSHFLRILCDIWDRSIRGQIDRWAMITVSSSVSEDFLMTQFLKELKGVVIR